MRWFWDVAIEPLLAAIKPRVVIEIGAEEGVTSAPLLELATTLSAVVHIIDPDPRLDERALKARFGDRLWLHRAKSLDVLAEIGPVDAVLIDGDHNWYTVHRELKALESLGALGGRSFPLTFMHDVSWPYARRDMYYDPESIPGRWRQPWARRPIVFGQRELGEGCGVNGDYANALIEGGPRNGVLTALEDFLAESNLDLVHCLIEGMAGLAVLVPATTLDEVAPLHGQWENLCSAEFLRAHIHRLANLLAARID